MNLFEHVLAAIPGDTQMSKYDTLNKAPNHLVVETICQGIEAWHKSNVQSSASPSTGIQQSKPT